MDTESGAACPAVGPSMRGDGMSTAEPKAGLVLFGGQNHDWRERLDAVVAMMREMSLQTDPQAMVRAYSARLRRLLSSDGFVALSRRDLRPPLYRITRASRWQREINPWTERDLLPVLEGGTLGE